MIVRMWGGRAKPGLGADYVAHLESDVLPEIERLPGSLGAQVLRAAGEDSESFVVLTYWTDIEAVVAFAGPDRDVAVVPESAQRLLSEFEPGVRHFDVVINTADTPGPPTA